MIMVYEIVLLSTYSFTTDAVSYAYAVYPPHTYGHPKG